MAEKTPTGGGGAGAGLEAAIGKQDCAGGPEDFDVVDEAFALAEHADVEPVGGLGAEPQWGGDGELLPLGLLPLVGVGPVVGAPGVGPGIDELEGRTAAVGPLAPAPAVAVGDLADDDVDGVHRHLAQFVGRPNSVGFGQGDVLAPVREPSDPVAEDL